MAKQIQEILIDDLDGGEANETVAFAIDGASPQYFSFRARVIDEPCSQDSTT